tara:strand:+ start:632 stop:1585 length:954 start_codon:yes stop_codon:yes gene_type:complete
MNKVSIWTLADSKYFARISILVKSFFKYEDQIINIIDVDGKLGELINQNLKDHSKKINVISLDKLVEKSKLSILKKKEIFFYITPLTIKYALEISNDDFILFLDADTKVYQNFIDHAINLMGVSSVGISFHGYKTGLSTMFLRDYGKYNVGFNLFKKNKISKLVVNDWNHDCENYFKNENNELSFFSDQIYLNKWIKNYGNHIHVFHNNGINISPRVTLKFKLKYKNNQYYIGDEKLRLFHFIGLKKISKYYWDSGYSGYLNFTSAIQRRITKEYITEISQINVNEHEVFLNNNKNSILSALKMILRFLNNSLIKIK